MTWFSRYFAVVLALVLWFAGPSLAAGTQMSANDLPRISVDEVRALQASGEKVVFLDTRTSSQWEAADRQLPGARRLVSNGDLKAFIDTVPKTAAVVTYCT